MISITNLVQNNISSSNASSSCISSNNNQCQQTQSSNSEHYSIKGLNCIFTSPLPTVGSKACSPYMVLKFNGSLTISSVCKILSNSAFWNDCLSFRVDPEQPEKLMTVEIHNYTLYQTEKDLVDPNFDEKDFLGSGVIDLSDILAQRQPIKCYGNNSNSSFTMIHNNNGSSNATSSIISNHSGLSNASQNNNLHSNSVYIGQAKIVNSDGLTIGSLQFNIHKEQQYSNTSSNTMISSQATSTSQQMQLDDNYRSLSSKLHEIIPQNNRNAQVLQQSLSLNTYFQPKSTCYTAYKRDTSEEREYRSNKNTLHTPNSSSNIQNQNNFYNNNNISSSNPFALHTMKSTISESDAQSTSIIHGQFNNPHLENSQTPRYHSYNMIKFGEEDQFNLNKIATNNVNSSSSNCQEDFEQQYEDQTSYYSSENGFHQQQINPFSKVNQQQQQGLQISQNQMSNEYTHTNVSPLRDIQGKNCMNDLSISQTAKPYVGFLSQFGQPIQYPQLYPQAQQQPQQQLPQQQQVGLINLQNIPYQQYNGTTPSTISTCSQRNGQQLNQMPYSNFTQAVQVLGQNNMNVVPNQNQQFQLQNNLIRTVQSQKTIVNKFPQNNCNNPINPVVNPAIFQYPNNNLGGQPINAINSAATPASLQKVNIGVSTSRQPFSAAATPFKGQRNGNFYQPF